MDACMSFWRSLVGFYSNHPYAAGLVTGVAAVLLLVVLFFLICRLFRAKAVPEVSYETKHGRVYIRASAITGLIASMKKDFPELTVDKIQLLQKSKVKFLLITVDFRSGNRPFPETADAFEEQVLLSLAETLGVKDIKRVELRMRENTHA